ncbi:uncharacterized protein FIBRA_03510 [Fibroporia radiculosa]|uniref:Iron hydrogenase large subunit C-terminal domain-containing protein n=1 Tax=Fibroporia radiculosa TaxID=599839 RepID=J4HW12_9APHY|nr:uncharacterized protein FIBRA_03510 [Fibroporia radiculosa]CCM01457.1 predicted protein [Fibroporia radiculosa]
MGALVKAWLGPRWGKRPDQIYHVAVMPCYDKKLEASRPDFVDGAHGARDVDCVITTGELALLMRERAWDLAAPVPGEDAGGDAAELPALITHPGTSSGSYLQSLISVLARADASSAAGDPASTEGDGASAAAAPQLEVRVRAVRGPDYEEHTLVDAGAGAGAVRLRGAKCYGFRNLQNVVRKVGRDAGVQVGRGAAGRIVGRTRGARVRKVGAAGEAERGYEYVEVMACPGGCANGGGQLKPPAGTEEVALKTGEQGRVSVVAGADAVLPEGEARWGNREWTKKVEEAYWRGSSSSSPVERGANGDVDEALLQADKLAARVLQEMCRPSSGDVVDWDTDMDEEAEARRRQFFRTQYRAVESEVVGLAVKW